MNQSIYLFLIENVVITVTSRLLSISKTKVIKRIKVMASNIQISILNKKDQYFELDEMQVVVGYKQNESWI